MERRTELIAYIKTFCRIYYDKTGTFYKDPGIRTLIDRAKVELAIIRKRAH